MTPAVLDLDRLRELAVRDQWRLDVLPWNQLALGALPESFRQAAADAFAQLQWGERTARKCAAVLAETLLPASARALCALQVEDEARHDAFFGRLIEKLGAPGRVRPSIERLMAGVEAAASPEAMVVGMQVLIEGVAHSLFTEAGRAFAALEADGEMEEPLRSMRRVVGDWMPSLLARDESRHIAFGLHFLAERIPELDRAGRAALEEQLGRWGEYVHVASSDPDVIDGAGVDGRALCDRLIADLNGRIAQIGLSTRIAPLAAS